MSSAQTPPRRPSPRVYRRRRAVALVLVVVVLVALVLGVVAIVRGVSSPAGSDAPSDTSSPTTSGTAGGGTSSTPAPGVGSTDGSTPTGEPTADATCTAEEVVVTAVTDATNYAADATPQLSLTLANTGADDCVINAGTSQQVFTVTSGSDTYWTSTDCQTGAADQEILLEAGSTVEGAPIAWDRTRSSPETCSGGRESVPAGGASYFLTVAVGDIESEPKQFLLQ